MVSGWRVAGLRRAGVIDYFERRKYSEDDQRASVDGPRLVARWLQNIRPARGGGPPYGPGPDRCPERGREDHYRPGTLSGCLRLRLADRNDSLPRIQPRSGRKKLSDLRLPRPRRHLAHLGLRVTRRV